MKTICESIRAVLGFALSTLVITTLFGQTDPFAEGDDDEFFVMLDSFAKYGGEIRVIDGMTGNNYTVANEVVISFHKKMPKIMGGFHNMLLAYEAKHMNFRYKDAKEHEKQLAELADSFGIRQFRIDYQEEEFLTRERAIFHRLQRKPFFKLNELVVWNLDRLTPTTMPNNKWSNNIRYDYEAREWQRRALTTWNVAIPRNNYTHHVIKFQGLNLDSNSGFHEMISGLPGDVHSQHFKEVKLSYPIFVTSEKSSEEQIEYLQRTFIKNLRQIYDPFSWVARRSQRFQTGFAPQLREHLRKRSYKVKNREWFNPTLANFLNDIVTIRRHGYGIIYQDFVSGAMDQRYENQLGLELDLLNWQPGEAREQKKKIGWGLPGRITLDSQYGARWVLIDAYLRWGETLVDELRQELTSLDKREEPIPIFKKVLAKVSGMRANEYIAACSDEQLKVMKEFHAEMQTSSKKEVSVAANQTVSETEE